MAEHYLADILGALIADLVRSEGHSAAATVDFMRAVGFEGGNGNDWGTVRYVTFSYTGFNARGEVEERVLRIPLLSLLPLPLHQASEAEYEFFFRVSAVHQLKQEAESRRAERARFGEFVDLVGDVAPYSDSSHHDSKVPRIKVKFVARMSDLPAGVASTLRRLEETSGHEKQ
jgi:hypothetical protein